MNNDEFRQRLGADNQSAHQRSYDVQRAIVRQSALNRATDIVTSFINAGDKAYLEADADTLKTMVFSFAQDFESWVFRPVDNDNTSDARQKRIKQLA